jgi:hypothetical protein
MKTPLESLLVLEGAAIQPTWTAGPTFYTGRPEAVRAHARIVLGAGSPVTQVVLKWQGTKDPADPAGWEDAVSRRDDNGVTELEHGYGAPNGPAAYSFLVDARGYLALRILGRSTSGVGRSGDVLAVDGITW